MANFLLQDALSWNIPLVLQEFTQADIDLILTIPLPPSQPRVFFFGHFMLLGAYTISSRYRLVMKHCFLSLAPSTSTSSGVNGFLLKIIWTLNVPPRILGSLFGGVVSTFYLLGPD